MAEDTKTPAPGKGQAGAAAPRMIPGEVVGVRGLIYRGSHKPEGQDDYNAKGAKISLPERTAQKMVVKRLFEPDDKEFKHKIVPPSAAENNGDSK